MGPTAQCVAAACGAVCEVNTDNEHIQQVLAALADPTRRQLLDALAALGQATTTILATHVTVSRQAVVKHLIVLHDAGLVSCRRIGREMRYTVCPEKLDRAAQWMANLTAMWDRRLESIKRMAE